METMGKDGVKPGHLVVAGVFGGICAGAALFSIIIVPIPGLPGGSGFWIPAGLYFALTLWFGFWGALAGHIGTFIGMGPFFGFTFQVWADGALGDFFAPLINLAIFRATKADPELKTRRDQAIWVVSVVISTCLASMWIHFVNYSFGTITFNLWKWGVVAYTIGDSAAVLIIGTLLLKTATKYFKTFPYYVKGLFS
nr:hypothetical protein [Candidatus Njordarchaeum guaymaensis]